MSARNWLECDELEISAALYKGAPLVRMCQSAGSMHFQFDMTPAGARAAAANLIAMADEAEATAAHQAQQVEA